MDGMDAQGAHNRPFFRCMSKFPMFVSTETPIADFLAARGVNLPAATRLQEEDVDYVASVVRRLLFGR